MVELIVGKKGKGKTKVLLDKVNSAVKEANGSIVYLDKSTKHMYELNNKVRLIDVSGFPIKNADEFVGFICGILSQDHDLEQIYLDSFLVLSLRTARKAFIGAQNRCLKIQPLPFFPTISSTMLFSSLDTYNINFD